MPGGGYRHLDILVEGLGDRRAQSWPRLRFKFAINGERAADRGAGPPGLAAAVRALARHPGRRARALLPADARRIAAAAPWRRLRSATRPAPAGRRCCACCRRWSPPRRARRRRIRRNMPTGWRWRGASRRRCWRRAREDRHGRDLRTGCADRHGGARHRGGDARTGRAGLRRRPLVLHPALSAADDSAIAASRVPQGPDVSIALAYSGEVQLELIQQRCDTPSMYRDFIAGRAGGHAALGVLVGGLRRRLARALAAGHRVGQEGDAIGRGRFAYLETTGHPGTAVEIVELTPSRAQGSRAHARGRGRLGRQGSGSGCCSDAQRRPNSLLQLRRAQPQHGGAAMAAGGRARRRLHRAQQRVHLGGVRRRPARTEPWQASRAIAASSRRSSASASPLSASSSARSRSSGAGSGAPSSAGSARTSTAPAPKPSISRPSRASASAASSRRRDVGGRQLDHGGQQQRLGAHAALDQLRAQRLMRQAFMRGVLVHQHQRAVRRLGQDVGVEDLRQRAAERMSPSGARIGGAAAAVGRGGQAAAAARSRAAGAARAARLPGRRRLQRLGEAGRRLGEAELPRHGRAAAAPGRSSPRPAPAGPARSWPPPPRGAKPADGAAPPPRRRPPARGAAPRSAGRAPRASSRKRSSVFIGWTFTSTALRRDVEEQRGSRVPPGGDQVAIGDAQRGAQQRVAHRAAVHHQVLLGAGGPRDRRARRRARRERRRSRPASTGRAAAAKSAPSSVADARLAVLAAPGPAPPARRLARGSRPRARPAPGGAPPRSPPRPRCAGLRRNFAPRRAWRRTGRAPRRACPARRRRARRRRLAAALDGDGVRVAAAAPCRERDASAAPPRRSRAAPRRGSRAWRCGTASPPPAAWRWRGARRPARGRRPTCRRRHPRPGCGRCRRPPASPTMRRGAGIERVLDQLLHRRGRPLHHLAGGDAVGGGLGQEADGRAGQGGRMPAGRLGAGWSHPGAGLGASPPQPWLPPAALRQPPDSARAASGRSRRPHRPTRLPPMPIRGPPSPRCDRGTAWRTERGPTADRGAQPRHHAAHRGGAGGARGLAGRDLARRAWRRGCWPGCASRPPPGCPARPRCSGCRARCWCRLRLLANLLDGMVAIGRGIASPVGELFNEVPDRVSDTAVLLGLGVAGGERWRWGWRRRWRRWHRLCPHHRARPPARRAISAGRWPSSTAWRW